MYNKQNIVIDVDDVLLNFREHITDFITKEFSINYSKDNHGKIIYPNSQSWDLGEFFGLSEEQLKHLSSSLFTQTKCSENFFLNIKAIDGAKNFLSEIIKSKLYNIHYVTSIQKYNADYRIQNLKEQFDDIFNEKEQQVHCVGLNNSKSKIVSNLKPTSMIDDRFVNIYECYPFIQNNMFWLDNGIREEKHNERFDEVNNSSCNLHTVDDYNKILETIL